MEREGASSSALRTTLEARASSYGPEDPALPDLPQEGPAANNHVAVDIQPRPNTTPLTPIRV